MDIKEVGINTRNWIDLAQDGVYWRDLVNAALSLRVPYVVELVRYLVLFEKTSFCVEF